VVLSQQLIAAIRQVSDEFIIQQESTRGSLRPGTLIFLTLMFHKVVQRRASGVMRSLLVALLQISSLAFCTPWCQASVSRCARATCSELKRDDET